MYATPSVANIPPERELQIPTPRPVRFTWKSRFLRYFLFNALLIGLVWGQWLVTTDIRELEQLADSGRVTQGTVSRRHVTYGKKTKYFLDYYYRVEGVGRGVQVFSDTVQVEFADFYGKDDGSPIPVTYLPSDPETHRMGGVNALRVADSRDHDYGLFLFFGVVSVVLVGGVEIYNQGRRLLLRDGQVVIGQVIDHKIVRGKSTTYKLVYRYEVPFNDMVYREVCVSHALFTQFNDGDDITVLYRENRPNYGTPYITITEAEILDPDTF